MAPPPLRPATTPQGRLAATLGLPQEAYPLIEAAVSKAYEDVNKTAPTAAQFQAEIQGLYEVWTRRLALAPWLIEQAYLALAQPAHEPSLTPSAAALAQRFVPYLGYFQYLQTTSTFNDWWVYKKFVVVPQGAPLPQQFVTLAAEQQTLGSQTLGVLLNTGPSVTGFSPTTRVLELGAVGAWTVAEITTPVFLVENPAAATPPPQDPWMDNVLKRLLPQLASPIGMYIVGAFGGSLAQALQTQTAMIVFKAQSMANLMAADGGRLEAKQAAFNAALAAGQSREEALAADEAAGSAYDAENEARWAEQAAQMAARQAAKGINLADLGIGLGSRGVAGAEEASASLLARVGSALGARLAANLAGRIAAEALGALAGAAAGVLGGIIPALIEMITGLIDIEQTRAFDLSIFQAYCRPSPTLDLTAALGYPQSTSAPAPAVNDAVNAYRIATINYLLKMLYRQGLRPRTHEKDQYI